VEFGAGWFGEVWGRVAGGGGGRQEFGVETSGVGGRGRGKFAAVGAVAGGVGGCNLFYSLFLKFNIIQFIL